MATSYVVTATRLYTVDKDGNRKRHLRGETITGLSAEDVARHKAAGNIASTSNEDAQAAKADPATLNPAEDPNAAVTTPDPTGIPDPAASTIVSDQNSAPPVRKPARAATKDVWVAYAVASGQMTQEAAEAKSRDTLRDELN